MEPEPQPPQLPPTLSAPAFAAHWRTLDGAGRKRAAEQAAQALHRAWRTGYHVDDVPPALWSWDPDTLVPSPPPYEQGDAAGAGTASRLALAAGLWLWSEWPGFGAVQQRCFLRALATAAGLSDSDRRNLERRAWGRLRGEGLQRAADIRDEVRQFVLDSCRQSVGARGLWRPDPRWNAAEFRRAIEVSLRSPEVTAKRSAINTVVRATLSGFDVAIKRFGPPARHRRWTYRWRASRARRAWIAGEVFRRLGLVTPEPLGFLEVLRDGRTTESYLITAWVDAVHLRDEVTTRPEAASAGPREDFRRAWLGLLWRGVYHADTKLENVLALRDVQGVGRYAWIDLECVHLAGLLTPYRVVRNLVQINGALPDTTGGRARMDFLARLPGHWARLKHPWCRRFIARWTARRQHREVRGRCAS